jgi:hypothetical protein
MGIYEALDLRWGWRGRGLYIPDSRSFKRRRYPLQRSPGSRDVACSPAIVAAYDLFEHRGMKSLAGEGSTLMRGVVELEGLDEIRCLSEKRGALSLQPRQSQGTR